MMKRLIITTSMALAFSFTVQAAGVDEYLKDAKNYLDKGEVKSAVIQLKNALQEDPASVEARVTLGGIYLQLADGASAEKEFRRAARLNAAPERWQTGLGRALLLQNNYDAVINEIQPDPTLSGAIQADVLNLRGQALLAKKQLKAAEKAFQQALRIRPDDPQASLGLIRIDLVAGNREAGGKALDALLQQNPDNEQALLLRGQLSNQDKNPDAALQDFGRVLELNPKSLQALLGRVSIYQAKGDFARADQDLEKLAKLAPGSPVVEYLQGASAFQQRKFDQAEEHVQKVLGVLPNHTRSQLIMGAILYSRGELTLADEYLSRALASVPGHLPTIKLLAAVRMKMRQPKRAIDVLEPAVARSGDDPQLLAMLGNAYLRVGRFQDGSDLLSRAVELEPELASLRTQLAFGLLAQGDTRKAIGELQSAVDLDQDLVQADILLVLSHLKNRETDAALKASKALEQRMPENPMAYNLTGLAYMAAGDDDNGRARFEKALQVDPDFTTARINLARIELKHGRLDAAEQQFRMALEKSPNFLSALIGMAGIAEQRGDRSGMFQWLEKARTANSKSSKPGLLMAQAYMKSGDKLKALQVASETASSFPNQPGALRMLGLAQLAAGEPNSAVRSLQQLSNLKPSAQNLTLLAKAQQTAKDNAAARDSLQRALEVKADYFPALATLGILELKTGNHDEALRIARQMQQINPGSAAGFELEGAALLAQKKMGEAIAAIEKAYQIQPSGKLAIKLAQLYGASGDKERALQQLQTWLSKTPGDMGSRTVYAVMLQGMGRADEAMMQYEQVLKANPDNVLVLNNLAWLYQTKGDHRAVELAKRAYDQASNRPEIVDTYGWALVRLESADRGLPLLQEAYAKAPENPEIGYHVGYAMMKSGRAAEGQKLLQRLIKNHPDSPFAEKARGLLK